jgi:hypothetical protein
MGLTWSMLWNPVFMLATSGSSVDLERIPSDQDGSPDRFPDYAICTRSYLEC